MAGEGKIFEKNFKDSCKAVKIKDKALQELINANLRLISVDRFYDQVGGFSGVKNICDFVVYKYPHQYYFELKSYLGNTIPITAVTDFQYAGLMNKRCVEGVFAGAIYDFRSYDNEVYFVDILDIARQKDIGKCSISINFAREFGVKLPVLAQRSVNNDYDIIELLHGIKARVII